MANFKKKNGHRKRTRLHGFRNRKTQSGRGDFTRLNRFIRRFLRASQAVDE